MRLFSILLAALLAAPLVKAETPKLQDSEVASLLEESPNPDYRGWDYLATALIESGIEPGLVAKILRDPRMPERSPVPFKLAPREPASIYNGFTSSHKLRVAEECLRANLSAFKEAEERFKVSRYVLAALFLIETQCGTVVGNQMVFNRLARVSTVKEPRNLQYNIEKIRKEEGKVDPEAVSARAQYLFDTFFPELRALFEVAEKKGIDILAIKGSIAGAFGIPQFLPTSYLRFGVDADGDGKVSLFRFDEAALSAAYFLHFFGWDDNADVSQKRKVLWHYNRSEAYGDAVLKVSILLKQRASGAVAAKLPASRKRSAN